MRARGARHGVSFGACAPPGRRARGLGRAARRRVLAARISAAAGAQCQVVHLLHLQAPHKHLCMLSPSYSEAEKLLVEALLQGSWCRALVHASSQRPSLYPFCFLPPQGKWTQVASCMSHRACTLVKMTVDGGSLGYRSHTCQMISKAVCDQGAFHIPDRSLGCGIAGT